MERWKGWMWFYFKSSFFLPTKCILVKVASCHKHKAEEKGHGLVSLYKDMEDCEGYEDIQVMWEIIHSSRGPNGSDNKSSKKPAH
ncbi:hypothetical protein Vadar_009591 [Vaccinium darrowii]|uniref:Uncharacterized protein n=1 Tax=Vaccinium darrowii TaxID=229202 RepID=A0ACB7ZII1_9ERIC|nr:hypothetical protein Vadar_009591 [Vaccinium darrowii]